MIVIYLKPPKSAERKAKQAELFRRLEIERGIGARASQKVLDDVVKAWGGYLRYMDARVVQLQMGEGNKITAEEIEDAFQNYLHEYYEFVEIDGCEVYFNRSEIDLDRKDYRGLTNKELMELGRAPIGADGKPMNLHHLTRRHPGGVGSNDRNVSLRKYKLVAFEKYKIYASAGSGRSSRV